MQTCSHMLIARCPVLYDRCVTWLKHTIMTHLFLLRAAMSCNLVQPKVIATSNCKVPVYWML